MNKKLLIVAIVLVVGLVGWILLRNRGGVVVNTPTPTISPTQTTTPVVTNNPGPTATPVSSNIITYTDSGYIPNMITIKKGETVVWKNESSNSMWTASAMHPLHRAYPGTDISACGTQTLIAMFDACAGVAAGQSWSFTFNNVGTWGYHNHRKATDFGKIVVE